MNTTRSRTPRRQGPRRAKPTVRGGPEDTRLRLIEAAGQLFAAKGFDGVSVRELSARAGANLAAIAYHFGSKEALYAEALRHGVRRVADSLRVSVLEAEADPARRFRRHVRAFTQALLSPDNPAWTTRLMLRELAGPTVALSKVVDEVVRPNFDLIRDTLAQLLPRGTDPLKVALHVFSVVGQCIHYRNTAPVTLNLLGWRAYPSGFAEQLADHVIDGTFRAIGRPELAGGRGP